MLRCMQAATKLGETIYKGHRSYDLMLNLQLGIRHSVQAYAKQPAVKELEPEHFTHKVNLVITHCKNFCIVSQGCPAAPP